MFSWLKSGDSCNGTKSEYEPLYPLPPPRRGQTQMLKYAVLSGCLCLGVAAVLIVVILDGTETASVTTNGAVGKGNTSLLRQDSNRKPAPALREGPFFLAEENEGIELDGTPIPSQLSTVPAASSSAIPLELTTVQPTASPVEDIMVEVEQGTLRGKQMKSRAGREYLAFLGVPYAKPPIGELRFKPPMEAEPWVGIRNATEMPLECIQKEKYNLDPTAVQGSEDCLYLNIYTPKSTSQLSRRRNRFPVMLYVHGGGPFGNATRYGADYFMDQDVTLVMMSYRLGALGNLNTNDSVTRGNQGLRDQVMAMEWIQDNIKRFGGDRRSVTLFGNSYGAAEVHVHVLSPKSKGLFHRAICESGNLLVQDMLNENPVQTAFEFGSKMNCTTTNSTELVECLRKIPVEEIARVSHAYPFLISIDTPSADDDDILPGHPLELLQNGQLNNVQMIYGVNSAEALFGSLGYLNDPNLNDYLNSNWNTVMAEVLKLNTSASNATAITEAAHEFYLGGKNVNRETQANFTNLLSDRDCIHPTFTVANFQSENNSRRKHVYMYYFSWEVAQKYSRSAEAIYKPTEFLGASHADELQLLFPYDDFPYIGLDSIHANLSVTMVKLWTSFAADGVPSGTTNEWEPIAAKEKPFKLFELNTNSLKMVDPLSDRMAFWDQFDLGDLYVKKDPLHLQNPAG